MSSPEALFLIETVPDPICGEVGCDIKENPDHFTKIRFSEVVRDTINDAIDYLEPDAKASPMAQSLLRRFRLILEADKP